MQKGIGIGDGWMVGLGDPVGLFQSQWFYDSVIPKKNCAALQTKFVVLLTIGFTGFLQSDLYSK